MTTTQAPPGAQAPAKRRGRVDSFWRREPGRPVALMISLAAAAVLVALWAWVTRPGGMISPLFLPPPGHVLDAAISLVQSPYLGTTLAGHILASLTTVLIGWFVAAAIGVPVGIWIGWSQKARWTAYPLFQLLRPIPPIAWIPLALVWFGIGDPSRIFVVFVASIVPWTLNSIQAVESVDITLIRAARVLGASQATTLRRVVVPTAVPTLLAGAQIALGNAWTTVIAAELLGAQSGLGYIALNSSRTLNTDILLVSMFTIGIIGALLSLLMRAAARALSPGSVKS